MHTPNRGGLVLWAALATVFVAYAETVSLSGVRVGRESSLANVRASGKELAVEALARRLRGLVMARAASSGLEANTAASRQQQTPPLRQAAGGRDKEPKLRKGEGRQAGHFGLGDQSREPWYAKPERLAKYLVQHMQWDMESTEDELEIYPFFRFEHKFRVPIPWPRKNEKIMVSTTVKPATPQAWTSASVQLVKGVNLVAALASDAAQPLTEPYMSIGAEYSLNLKAPDRILNQFLEFLQRPLGEPIIGSCSNDFIVTVGKTNYGGKGPEAHAGIASGISIGALRLRSSITRDIHGRNRWRLSI